MSSALWITLIGMGLVFIAILLLWGLMALLVRLTAEKEPAAPDAGVDEALPVPEIETSSAVPSGALDLDRKRRAAAAAVALAMLLRRAETPARAAVQADGSLSAWQAVHRAGQLSRKSGEFRKKVA